MNVGGPHRSARIELAQTLGFDGVHVPAQSMSIEDARRRAGWLVGASTHTLDEVRAAAQHGADLVTFGPVWDTPSKRDLLEPTGCGPLARASRAHRRVYALGGLRADRVAEALAAGSYGIACIGAVLAAADPEAASAELIHTLTIESARRADRSETP